MHGQIFSLLQYQLNFQTLLYIPYIQTGVQKDSIACNYISLSQLVIWLLYNTYYVVCAKLLQNDKHCHSRSLNAPFWLWIFCFWNNKWHFSFEIYNPSAVCSFCRTHINKHLIHITDIYSFQCQYRVPVIRIYEYIVCLTSIYQLIVLIFFILKDIAAYFSVRLMYKISNWWEFVWLLNYFQNWISANE